MASPIKRYFLQEAAKAVEAAKFLVNSASVAMHPVNAMLSKDKEHSKMHPSYKELEQPWSDLYHIYKQIIREADPEEFDYIESIPHEDGKLLSETRATDEEKMEAHIMKKLIKKALRETGKEESNGI